MSFRRYYAATAPQKQLNVGVSPSDVQMQVSDWTGYPTSFPFWVSLELGTANVETVLVTAITGTTATVTRAQDGTTAVAHPAGATINQTFAAVDADEANAHINSNTGVHGVTGVIADTGTPQFLANKTLTSPVIQNSSITNGTATGLTLTDAVFSDFPTGLGVLFDVFASVNGGETDCANASNTQLNIPNVAYDNLNLWDSVNKQFTLPAGIYILTGSATWGGAASGVRRLGFNISGNQMAGFTTLQADGTNGVGQNTTYTLVTGSTAFVQLEGYQNSGSTIGAFGPILTVLGKRF